MRISVFGVGYVGAVSSACLVALGHEVVAVDVSAAKLELIEQGKSPIVEARLEALIAEGVAAGRLRTSQDVAAAIAGTEISFISVGTPSGPDGRVAMAAVEHVLAQIGTALRDKTAPHCVVMRSTVPPGTAETVAIPVLERTSGRRHGVDFFYYSNPEFLREGSAVQDFYAPPFTLFGAAAGDDGAAVRRIYAGVESPVHVVPYRVAEGAKYLANVFHAVKLAFANEAGAILAAHGVDARESFRIFCEDRVLNISSAYLRPGFAFGGSCLPKDVRSFLALAQEAGVAAPFLSAVLPSNDANIARVAGLIMQHGRKKVALFGLAFKSGTDDLRESPYVLLAEHLLGKGFDLRIYDESVQLATLMGTNRAYIEREIPHIERLMAATAAQALEGAAIVVLGHIGAADRAALPRLLEGKVVLDLAGMNELRHLPGVLYQGICW
jgi:GDP-mannose 6-dehydrogenase